MPTNTAPLVVHALHDQLVSSEPARPLLVHKAGCGSLGLVLFLLQVLPNRIKLIKHGSGLAPQSQPTRLLRDAEMEVTAVPTMVPVAINNVRQEQQHHHHSQSIRRILRTSCTRNEPLYITASADGSMRAWFCDTLQRRSTWLIASIHNQRRTALVTDLTYSPLLEQVRFHSTTVGVLVALFHINGCWVCDRRSRFLRRSV